MVGGDHDLAVRTDRGVPVAFIVSSSVSVMYQSPVKPRPLHRECTSDPAPDDLRFVAVGQLPEQATTVREDGRQQFIASPIARITDHARADRAAPWVDDAAYVVITISVVASSDVCPAVDSSCRAPKPLI